MKNNTTKQRVIKIVEYIVAFITVIIVSYFLDGRKFTKDGLFYAIFITAIFVVLDVIKYISQLNKSNNNK